MATPRDAVRAAIDQASEHWSHGRVDDALACCEAALRIDPRNVDALAHTGTILWLKGDLEATRRLYDEAHAIDPHHVGVILNIATLHNECGDLETSLRWVERAEALRPDLAEVRWRKGLLELAMGNYVDGWAHYEAGLLRPGLRGIGPGFTTPPWDGAPCDRLLLWHEQGFGDTVQFVRYAELCKQSARRVIVLCPAELVALIASCPCVDEATESIGVDQFDRQLSILSLPHRFGTTLASVPATVPYLFADPTCAARWGARMQGKRLKVGLVWAGNFRGDQARFQVIDRHRNMPLQALKPLLEIEGVDFYSLQKGEAAREAKATRIVDWMDEVDTFADTAALIEHLDLVISVDTSVVHVAGAMGKPVWVLSRLDACWRWLRNRPDSPWYPTARVFGQSERGDWSDVIASVRAALSVLTQQHPR